MNIMSFFMGKKMEAGLIKQLESEALELKKLCEKNL
jgi:hypothetical protein